MHVWREDVEYTFGGKKVVVPFVAFDVIANCGMLLGTREAVPLLLAWAMTIHRAQGASIDSLAAEFTNLHWKEPGLIYSGLSRCRLFENLYVRGLRRDHIVVSPDALESIRPERGALRVECSGEMVSVFLFICCGNDNLACHAVDTLRRNCLPPPITDICTAHPRAEKSVAEHLLAPLRLSIHVGAGRQSAAFCSACRARTRKMLP